MINNNLNVSVNVGVIHIIRHISNKTPPFSIGRLLRIKMVMLPEIHDLPTVVDWPQKIYVQMLKQVVDDKVHHGLANLCNGIVLQSVLQQNLSFS